jgi:hypothetical protein
MPRRCFANGLERAAAHRAQKLAWKERRRRETEVPGGAHQFSNDGHRDRAPPSSVIAERDRVLAQPRTITEMLLGDPPPGRSALDMRSPL